MKERPILFSGAMVNAILSGAKTQTRRMRGLEFENESPNDWAVIRRMEKVEPCIDSEPCDFPGADDNSWLALKDERGVADMGFNCLSCPYGKIGDRLWVRERMRVVEMSSPELLYIRVRYEADHQASDWFRYPDRLKGKPVVGKCLSYGGFREVSRINLEITSVRVERLNEISRSDAATEGICSEELCEIKGIQKNQWPEENFRVLWDKINGKKHPWASNPFVWVIEFKRV